MKNLFFTLLGLLLSNLYFAQTYSLTAAMSGTTISTCSGTFVDDGGSGGNYTRNQNRTITFCPATPGDVIKVTFTTLALQETGTGACEDILDVYQGDAAYAAPLITAGTPDDRLCGTSTGTNLPVFYSTSSSGCITFHFRENDNTKQKAGWVANISCVTPCKTPTASLVSSSIVNICGPTANNPGSLSVSFNASSSTVGAYGAGGSTVTLANYNWVFGDGTSLTSTTSTVSHTYPSAPGVYVARLTVVDNNFDISSSGCSSTNSTTRIIRVLPAPTFTASTVSPQNLGCGSNATLTGVAKSQTETQSIPAVTGVTVALPDGSGNSFVSGADFSGLFPTGATISSGCYPILWFNLEHSYSGDLFIDLIAPSGETIRVYNRNGGGTNFGTCSNGADDGVPGCGQTYSVSNTGTLDFSLVSSGTTTSSSCASFGGPCEAGYNYINGVYMSETPFSNLNGAQMNGVWQIKITDNLNLDDGFLFGWGLVFPTSCYTPLESVTPDLTTAVWTNGGSGPAVPVSQTTTTLAVTDPGPDACPTAGTCTGNQLTNTINFGPFNTPGTYPYLYTATDEFGCTYTNTVNVAVSCACPSLTAMNYGGPFCKSLTSGITPTVTGSGAISVGAYSATPAGLSIDASSGVITPSLSTANTYTVTYLVTPSAGTCTPISVTTVVTVYANPTVAVANTTICDGSSATLTASGATTYTWNTGENTATVTYTPSSLTVYTVTGSTNGCSDTKTVSISVTSNPTVAVSNATVCSGSSTTFTASGATTYSWSTGASTSTITTSTAGVYTVTGTTSGCTNTQTVSLTVTANPTVSVSNATVCAGASTVITASGATTYSWSTGALTSTISTSTAGVYTVTGTTNGCSNTKTVSLTVTSNPTVAVTNATTCAGTAVTYTASGATTYSWSTGASTSTISTSTAGVYTVTGTTSGCTNTQTVSLTVTANPTVAVSNATTCAGTAVTFTASGATTYSWSTGATTSTISTSTGGTYTVTGTQNGCTNTKTVSLTVNSIPTTVASTSGTITCATPSVTLNSSLAGANYTWTAPAGGIVSSVNSQSTSASAASGVYTLNVLSAAGCSYSTTTSVSINTTAPTGFSAGSNQTLACSPASVALTGVVGTPANATLSWTGPNVCGSSTTIATAACGAGTYTLTATDPVNGCIQTSTVSVSPSAGAPSVTVTSSSQTITCTNTLAAVSVSTTASPVTYAWSGPGIVGTSTLSSISVNQGGTYTYTVLNTGNNCPTSNNIVVLQNTTAPSVTSSSTGSLNCTTTSVDVSASTTVTPVTYAWSGTGITTTNTLSTISVNQGGTFNYTVTNTNNNCVTTGSVSVIQNSVSPSVTSSSTGSLNCTTTSVDVSASTTVTPVTYAWSGTGITTTNTLSTVSVNQGGTFNYTVTNTNNNCVTTGSVSVIQDAAVPSVTSSSTGSLNCTTTSVDVSASTTVTPVTYAWSGTGITTTNTLSTVSVNQGGTFNYTVTNTDNNCVTSGSVTVVQDAVSPSVTSSTTGSLNCTTTSVDVSASTTVTPVTYAWSGTGITTTNTLNTVSVNQGGIFNYTVTNTDNNCVTTGSVSVIQDVNTPTVSVSSTQTITCASPTVTLVGSAVPANCDPVWTGGVTSGANSYTATATSASVFTITVTDPFNFCTAIATTTVVADAGFPQVSTSVTNSLNCLVNTADVVATTTSTPVSYSWSGSGITTGANTATATVNQGGIYTVTVTNTSSSCESVVTVSVTQNTTVPSVAVSPSQTLTCALPTLVVSSTVTPSGSYTYTWTGAGILSATNADAITVNAAGNYVLEVTDAVNGCTNTATANVDSDSNLPSASILATSSNTVITCNNSSVSLLADVTPVTSVYSYSWTTGANTASISVGSSSIVGVVVTNTLTGCSSAATITISNNTVVPSVSSANASIPCGTSSISLTSSASNVTYNWTTTNGSISSGATSSSPVVTSAGDYVLTVTDITNGCVNTATAVVTQTNINVAISANPLSGTAPLVVTFSDLSTGVANWAWDFGDSNTSTAPSPVHTFTAPGIYVVSLTGTDAALACSNTVTLTIEVFENTTIIIPNVFTPNGDGANDLFKIVTTGMKDLNVDIFNRWGTKIHTITSPSGSWDGSGSSDGTYFFILKAKGYDGKDYTKEGYINLYR